jgi:hypothetical protein
LTSDRQLRANQANGKASRGPKTKAGKARSAQNALRHGLSIPVCKEPSLSIQAEEIALKLAALIPMRGCWIAREPLVKRRSISIECELGVMHWSRNY